MRQVARSPKRSSHEDSDVQRDVNIRVHEGAIDSVAMRMIMSKKESGAGENNTPFDFVVFFVFIAPRAPQFQCCFVVGGAVAKRSVYFEAFVPQQRTINIEIGGSGVADERKRTQEKGVLFSPAPEWEFGSRCVVLVESDLELLVTRRSSVKLRHCMVSVCSWAGLISNRLLCFTHRSFN